LRILLQISG